MVRQPVQGWQKQLGDDPSTISRIMGTQLQTLGGSGGMPPPKEVLENQVAKYAIFLHIFTISMKDILYITFKVQAAQMSVYKMTLKKFFFTINGLAKTRATGPLSPALQSAPYGLVQAGLVMMLL